MLKKVILVISTDDVDIEYKSLGEILQSDIVDYEFDNLTKEERECYD